MGKRPEMKKLVIATLIFTTLNLNSQQPVTAEMQASTEMLNKIKIDLIHTYKKTRLPKVVKYLTTKANKTAYVYSGSTPKGWDCSGMVRWTYKQVGITLPHSANKQAHIGTRVSEPKVGDIVAFAYKGSTDFYHTAIYLGNDLIINANREYDTTVIEPLNNFKASQIRFIRVLE
jgi:hypothetical protein